MNLPPQPNVRAIMLSFGLGVALALPCIMVAVLHIGGWL